MTLPPGPRAPAALQFVEVARRLPSFLERCASRYGDTFTLRLPIVGTFVVFSAPDDLHEIFTTPYSAFDDGGPYSVFARAFGPRSLLTFMGDEHRRERGLLGPHLRGAPLRARAESMRATALHFLDAAPRGEPVALRPLMESISFAVVAEATLGLRPGAEQAALLRALGGGRHPVLYAGARRFRPDLSRGWDEAEAWIRAHVADRRAAGPNGGPEDILDHLLGARDREGEPLSAAALETDVLMLLVTGYQTTAGAIAWAIELILRHPEARARIDAELARADGDWTATRGFEYLDATIKETLRLRPVVPIVCRRLASPLSIGGHALPAGVTVTPAIHLAHRRPDAFPEPDEFRPERFVDGHPAPYAWLPFGGGFRRCVGASFALLEMRVLIATTLSAVPVELASPDRLEVQRGRITGAPSSELKVVLG